MPALTTIVVVGAIAWGVSRAMRSGRTRSAAPPPPAWAGDADAPAPPGSLGAAFPSLAGPLERVPRPVPSAAASVPRATATTQATAPQPIGGYPLASRPQRRRPDRTARLMQRARGPGLCSPRPHQ